MSKGFHELIWPYFRCYKFIDNFVFISIPISGISWHEIILNIGLAANSLTFLCKQLLNRVLTLEYKWNLIKNLFIIYLLRKGKRQTNKKGLRVFFNFKIFFLWCLCIFSRIGEIFFRKAWYFLYVAMYKYMYKLLYYIIFINIKVLKR